MLDSLLQEKQNESWCIRRNFYNDYLLLLIGAPDDEQAALYFNQIGVLGQNIRCIKRLHKNQECRSIMEIVDVTVNQRKKPSSVRNIQEI